MSLNGPLYCGQREEGHGIVHHVLREHHQYYIWHHYPNTSILDRKSPTLFLSLSILRST